MNFVVIMNDTLRPDYLAAYGNDWCVTPSSARFAETAAVFDNSYVGSFPTIPNRTDLFTGRFGEPFHPWLPLDYGAVTLPQILRENGWATQFLCDCPHLIQAGANFDYPFNAWRVFRGNEVDRYGMDSEPVIMPFGDLSKTVAEHVATRQAQYLRSARERVHEEDWTCYQTFQCAVNWLERNRDHEKFFLWIDAFDPHEPNIPPGKYVDLYDPGYTGDVYLTHVPDPSKLSEAEIHNVKARYAASVTFMDRCVGRVLTAIDDLGLADSTCVVWLSDHGTHLNEHDKILTKNCAFNEVARTVLMIRTPGCEASAGQHLSDLVQPADLAPTLLDLAGLPVPDAMQGSSYLSLLRGGEWAGREVAFSGGPGQRIGVHGEGNFRFAVHARDRRWILLGAPHPRNRVLYDAENDPGQTADVAADHPDEVERLHAATIDFLKSHEAQPQVVRLWETADPGDLTGCRHTRPGFEHYAGYWDHIYDAGELVRVRSAE